jgi:AbrB family looped-hinge helix DNA binding protein
MTMQKSSHVRVKRKGQVTLPSELRSKLGIEEGALLEVNEEEGTITLKPTPRLKAGKSVGEEEYKKIIRELDEGRRNWR